MIQSDWFDWFRIANTKFYLNIVSLIWLLNDFLYEMLFMRNRTRLSIAIIKSINDVIYLRILFIHISKKALCLINVIWRYYWIISSLLELIWHALSARHSALFSLRVSWVSINNVISYCRFNEVIAGFELKRSWRIYIDLIYFRDLSFLNINFITNQVYYHHNQIS